MTDTQATQVIIEVAELATPATNVSQVVLEIAWTPLTPINQVVTPIRW